jgi:uncharacterized protein YdeI (YjbR/CyaY-like superfamily)
MPEESFNPKVDVYINKAAPFAQPILEHVRELVHKACPDAVETYKWSMPFFEYRGTILLNIAAFKAHCRMGFWAVEMKAIVNAAAAAGKDNAAALDHITSVKDLPANKIMLGWIRHAAALVESGENTSPISARAKKEKPAKAEFVMPETFAAELRKNKQAATVFANFSPSCKREYVEWIVDAKRAETRDKRIATAIEWIAEG